MEDSIKFCEPYVGQRFSSWENCQLHYQGYGKQEGLHVKIRSSRKHVKSNDLCSVLFTCKQSGSATKKKINLGDDNDNETKKKSTKVRDVFDKTNCEARLFVVHDKTTNDWVVRTYERSHNHEFVSPIKRNLIQTEKNISPVATSLIEVFADSNLGVNRMVDVFKTQAGGLEHVPFTERNIRNKLRDIRKKNFVEHDGQEALKYLDKLRVESGGQFFFDYRLDEENHIDILIWVDGRSKLAYQNFGDVVTFDTTYRTNKFDLPFAPFTGVNNHYLSITFGFALLRRENEESFTWMFDSWLGAMNNVAPKTLFTDQDLAMAPAIAKVFPDTRHLLCSWHISRKFPSHLSQLYSMYPDFKSNFDLCVKKSLTIDAFEENWAKLDADYNLANHDWLQGLYRLKEKWIPAYIKQFFAAGMISTQRSESMNSKFSKYFSSHTSMIEFVKKTIEVVDEECLDEKLEDYLTSVKSRSLVHQSPLESHAATLYTKEMFRQFQVEILKTNAMTILKKKEESTVTMKVYTVWNALPNKPHRHYTVILNKETNEMCCNCLLFEHRGMPCRHLLRMLVTKGYTEIPKQLVMIRWTRQGNKMCGQRTYDSPTKVVDFEDSQVMRYNHLSQKMLTFACDASCSKEAYRYMNGLLDNAKSVLDELIAKEQSLKESQESNKANEVEPEETPSIDVTGVLDPIVSQTKGRKKQPRIKSGIEEASKKTARKCSICNAITNHDARNHDKVMGLKKPL